MKRRLKLLLAVLHYFGIGWLLFRVQYTLLKRLGWFRLYTPSFALTDRPLFHWVRSNVPTAPADYAIWRRSHGGEFFFDASMQLPFTPPEGIEVDRTIAEAESILKGQWRYYSYRAYDIGYPPDWFYDPLTGHHQPSTGHWSQLNEFGSADIKNVWEINRFRSAFILGRAYLLSGDERYPEVFWQLIEDWSEHNPPNTGVNWLCGQEASLRVMAWCFGFYACIGSPHTTPERVVKMATMIAIHGERIESNITYAISQNNNHGISEAVGLLTIGLLFPEFKKADYWRQRGEQILKRLIPKQIFDDGGFVQYSFNYHRLMLHVMLWAIRLSALNNQDLPEAILKRVLLAAEFLFQMLNLDNGHVPNSGSNDGALVLALTSCDYRDYRPILQSTFALLNGKRLFSSGPWDEEAFWLLGNDFFALPETTKIQPVSFQALTSGYHTIRSEKSWLMVHAGHYLARPHHADQLHIDLWWRGLNIARDAGTYSYNAPAPWDRGLIGTAVHNTVTVDKCDQMTRASRFLWIDWNKGYVQKFNERTIEATHDGYMRFGVQHKRTIIHIDPESWLVIDTLQSNRPHLYTLQWLLPDITYEMGNRSICLETKAGDYVISWASDAADVKADSVRADTNSLRGWESPYYSHRQPALSLQVEGFSTNALFATLFSPMGYHMELSNGQIVVATDHSTWHFSPNSNVL